MGAAAVGRRLSQDAPSGAAGWYVYMLRCADGTLYTGITTDVTRRVAEHNGDAAGGARYTRSRRPVELAYVEAAADRAEATRREAAIKRLDRTRKQALCAAPFCIPPSLICR